MKVCAHGFPIVDFLLTSHWRRHRKHKKNKQADVPAWLYYSRRLIPRPSESRLASGVIGITSVEPLVALLRRRCGPVSAASLRNGSPLSSSCCLQTLIDSYITGPLSFSLIRSGPYWRNFRSLTRLIDWLLATV